MKRKILISLKSNLFIFSLRNYVFRFMSNACNLDLCLEEFSFKLGYLNICLIQKSAKKGQMSKNNLDEWKPDNKISYLIQ